MFTHAKKMCFVYTNSFKNDDVVRRPDICRLLVTVKFDFSFINIFKLEMAYFDMVGCMNKGKSTYMECALKSSEVFLENERRQTEIRSQQYQRKIEQDAANEKTTRVVILVIVLFVVIII